METHNLSTSMQPPAAASLGQAETFLELLSLAPSDQDWLCVALHQARSDHMISAQAAGSLLSSARQRLSERDDAKSHKLMTMLSNVRPFDKIALRLSMIATAALARAQCPTLALPDGIEETMFQQVLNNWTSPMYQIAARAVGSDVEMFLQLQVRTLRRIDNMARAELHTLAPSHYEMVYRCSSAMFAQRSVTGVIRGILHMLDHGDAHVTGHVENPRLLSIQIEL